MLWEANRRTATSSGLTIVAAHGAAWVAPLSGGSDVERSHLEGKHSADERPPGDRTDDAVNGD
jgi:hypothetical protein